jgi:hypothetical protein
MVRYVNTKQYGMLHNLFYKTVHCTLVRYKTVQVPYSNRCRYKIQNSSFGQGYSVHLQHFKMKLIIVSEDFFYLFYSVKVMWIVELVVGKQLSFIFQVVVPFFIYIYINVGWSKLLWLSLILTTPLFFRTYGTTFGRIQDRCVFSRPRLEFKKIDRGP